MKEPAEHIKKQLELEFKSIIQQVSIHKGQNGQAEIISIQEEQIHLAGSTSTIQNEGLSTETNTVEVSSRLGEEHHHHHNQEETEKEG